MEPPESVIRAMEPAGVVVCSTSVLLTHTRTRETATKTGVRVTTTSDITDRMLSAGAITAGYREVERLTAALTEKLTTTDEARIEAGGASTTMPLSGRDGTPSNGIITNPGDPGSLPPGESYVAPVEGTAADTLVFDGDLVGVGVPDDPLTVELDAEHITFVEGVAAGEFLDVTGGDGCTRRVCELSLGMSPTASIIGTVLGDGKVYGTCHVAFGGSFSLDGTIDCDSHLDGVILEPTVLFDGDVVIADSKVYV